MREDAERLVNELRELIERARQAAGDPEGLQRHEQLGAIGRTVGELERKGIPVPDDLRRLKTELAAGLSEYEESSEALAYVRMQLPPLLEPLGLSLRQTGGRSRNREAQRGRPPSGDLTPMAALGTWIEEALTALGGTASPSDVRRWIEQEHEQDLTPGDREPDASGRPSYRSRLRWMKYNMVQSGRLRRDAPAGRWELADGG